VVLFAELLTAMGVMAAPEQMVWEATLAVAITLGFTFTTALMGVPVQLPVVGVMVNCTLTGSAFAFTRLPVMLPVPLLPAVPVIVAVLFLVQL
jgi:hypothetical protein